MSRVLLLAGTAEARELAAHLAELPIDLTVSLAGVTDRPAAYPGRVRTGGFGGAQGLARFLDEQRVDAMIDATHPFAARISAHAARAVRQTGRPALLLSRPAWVPGPGEVWQAVPDLPSALAALPAGARAFFATGAGTAAHLAGRPDLSFVLRSIEPVEGLPPRVTHILARPPFTEAAERQLFARESVTHLVTRNAGGAPGRTKLAAAAALGLEVVMIDRPPPPEDVETVATVPQALAWARRVLSLDSASDPAP